MRQKVSATYEKTKTYARPEWEVERECKAYQDAKQKATVLVQMKIARARECTKNINTKDRSS